MSKPIFIALVIMFASYKATAGFYTSEKGWEMAELWLGSNQIGEHREFIANFISDEGLDFNRRNCELAVQLFEKARPHVNYYCMYTPRGKGEY